MKALKARLAKLEARLAPKRLFSRVVLIGVFNDLPGYSKSDIIGAGIGGRNIYRLHGETVDALTERASSELGMQFLFAIYSNGSQAC